MKRNSAYPASAILLAALSLQAQQPNQLTPAERAAGWHLLFDGKTSTGWRSARSNHFPTTGWAIQNGTITVAEQGGEEAGNGGDIITRRTFANFELSVDFRVSPGANSGIMYFVDLAFTPGHNGAGSPIGFEYQILDDALHPDATRGKNGDRTVASLYDLLPAATNKPIKPVGDWNTARIIVRGQHGEHWLNGVKVLEYDRDSPRFKAVVAESKFAVYPHFGEANRGYILLQDHGFPVSFRNLRLRELPPDRAK